MCELAVDAVAGAPCCRPATRDPAAVLAWSEARVNEDGPDGAAVALWLPRGVTVAIGLAQTPEREADAVALERDGVGLVRRQSGGGAVLLYDGVLCWEAWADLAAIEQMRDGGSGIRESYAALSAPVVRGLAALGVHAFHAGICDISVATPGEARPRKLAGTAQLRRRKRALVHGSLLVTADVSVLSRYLCFPSEQPDYREGRGHADFCTTVARAAGSAASGDFVHRVAGAIATAALADGWRVLTPPEELDDAAAALLRGKYGERAWNWEKKRPL